MDRFWPAAICAVAAVGPLTLAASNPGQPLDAGVLVAAWALVAGGGLLVGIWSRRLAVLVVAVVWMFWHYPLFGDMWWVAVGAVGGAVWIASQWEWFRSSVVAAGVLVLFAPLLSIVTSNPVAAQPDSTDTAAITVDPPTHQPSMVNLMRSVVACIADVDPDLVAHTEYTVSNSDPPVVHAKTSSP